MRSLIRLMLCIALCAGVILCACGKATPTPQPKPTITPTWVVLPTATPAIADPNKEALTGAPVQPAAPSATPSPRLEPTASPTLKPTATSAPSDTPTADEADVDKGSLSSLPLQPTPTADESGVDKEGLSGMPLPGTTPPPRPTPTPDDSLAAEGEADKESVFSAPIWITPMSGMLLMALCGFETGEPMPAIGLRVGAQGALVCLAGFPSDQPIRLTLYAPAGQLAAEQAGRVSAGQPITLVGLDLALPGAERPGVWRAVVELPGQTFERQVTVANRGTLSGRVVWNEGPIPNVQVSIRAQASPQAATLGEARTDADGRFSISDIPLGFVAIYAKPDDPVYWVWALQMVDVRTDGVTDAGDVAVCRGFDPVSPTGGAVLPRGQPVRFAWAAVPGAVEYELRVFTGGQFAFQGRTETTEVSVALAPNPDYGWRVDGFNAQGHIIACSRPRTLRVE
jgi:hypothetical protein